MTLEILYPDAQFEGEPTDESRVFGTRAHLTIMRERQASAIPEAIWRQSDALVCYHDVTIDRPVIDRLDKCRLIVRAGVGFDQIDIANCAARGIPVCNTPDYGTTDVADHTIALILALARGVVTYSDVLKADPVKGWDFATAPTVRRLAGQTMGIVGLGRIGTATALRAKALGMTVLFFDPYRTTGTELSLGFFRADTLEDLLARADVVSIHTPLTEETRDLFGRAAIGRMREGAFLINTARGPVVDPDAVLEGLRTGRLGGAALDVLPGEPPSGSEALIAAWRAGEPVIARRLILTPHAAFYSASSLTDLRRKSAEVAADYLFAGRLRDCVNGLDRPGAQRR